AAPLGRELIVAGLEHLLAARETVEAMLVARGAPRIRAVGIDVPGPDRHDAGERIYQARSASATLKAATGPTTRCDGGSCRSLAICPGRTRGLKSETAAR